MLFSLIIRIEAQLKFLKRRVLSKEMLAEQRLRVLAFGLVFPGLITRIYDNKLFRVEGDQQPLFVSPLDVYWFDFHFRVTWRSDRPII